MLAEPEDRIHQKREPQREADAPTTDEHWRWRLQMAERIASERVSLNAQHFKLWGAVVSRLFESLQKAGLKGDDVRNLENGRSVRVRINDRGPFTGGRIIDVSKAAAARLGMISSGTANVSITRLN